MLTYYRVERDAEKRYVFTLYYRGLLGQMKEMHRSVHQSPKQINEVVMYYKHAGYRVQSVVTA